MATPTDQMRRRQAAMEARRKTSVPDAEPLVEDSEAVNAAPVVVSKGTQLPMVPDDVLPDMSRTLTSRDLVMPKLLIGQGLSKAVQSGQVKLGHFYHSTNLEDLGTTIHVIPVDWWKSRSRFVNGVGVLCRSFDMVQGEGDPGILCEGTATEFYTLPERERGCTYRLWPERDKATGRTPGGPPCGENYHMPMVIITDPDDLENSPLLRGMYTFRKTGNAVAKGIITSMTEGDLDWGAAVFKFSVVSKTNASGQTYSNPAIELVGPAMGAALEKAKEFASTINATNRRTLTEKDDTQDY